MSGELKKMIACKGIKLYHNCRSRMDLDGHMPAQRAGVEIRGDDKWKVIIIENVSSTTL